MSNSGDDPHRAAAVRDHDRILYSLHFRRLASITQVAGPAGSLLFHNRLTHSLKVAQIARSVATVVLSRWPNEAKAMGGVDPMVTQAAAMAHDLGHPPFGHIAEEELNELATGGPLDGFEGNQQSFRIVTKLSFRRPGEAGLNLTRATLRAILKYPAIQGGTLGLNPKAGVYASERKAFEFATRRSRPTEPGVEARIMDFADDISYALHDAEDFIRAGMIPMHALAQTSIESDSTARPELSEEARAFLDNAMERLTSKKFGYTEEECKNAFFGLQPLFPITEPYVGNLPQQSALREFTSANISRYMNGVSLAGNRWSVPRLVMCELGMLKQLTWFYVIDHPSMTTPQRGQRQLIRSLFIALMSWTLECLDHRADENRLPVLLKHLLTDVRSDAEAVQLAEQGTQEPSTRLKVDGLTVKASKNLESANRTAPAQPFLVRRAVIDYIASLTELQAIRLNERLTTATPLTDLDRWLGA